MEQKLFSTTGKEIGTVQLNENVFGVVVSTGSIYHAVRNEAADRRVGTACTKTRAEVNYSNTKLKATSIYVSFWSTTKTSFSKSDVTIGVDTQIGDETLSIHRGSVLYVDDLSLSFK